MIGSSSQCQIRITLLTLSCRFISWWELLRYEPKSSTSLHLVLTDSSVILWEERDSNPLTASPLRRFVEADEFYRLMPLSSHCISTLCFCLDLCHLSLLIPQSMFLFMLIKSTQLQKTIASLTLVASKRLRLIWISFTGHQMLYFDCYIKTFATLLSL